MYSMLVFIALLRAIHYHSYKNYYQTYFSCGDHNFPKSIRVEDEIEIHQLIYFIVFTKIKILGFRKVIEKL